MRLSLHHQRGPRPFQASRSRVAYSVRCSSVAAGNGSKDAATSSRRGVLAAPILLAPLLGLELGPGTSGTARAEALLDTRTPMDALRDKDYGKARMKYPDFQATPSGLQYKDYREGTGEVPKKGDTVVVDWTGVTIGYYGRPFEARNKPKGSSFSDDKDYIRVVLGKDELIPAWEEALSTMKVGGIRRIIVPEELGYPGNGAWRTKGPQPSTFAGERALGFVLDNRGMIDKTLLFDIELKAVQHPARSG